MSVESHPGTRSLFRATMKQGYHLAILYGACGLVLELLHQMLPMPIYQRFAGAAYGLPMKLLLALGIEERLVGAVARGNIPAWAAGAAIPASGMLSILVLAFLVGISCSFLASLSTFRQG